MPLLNKDKMMYGFGKAVDAVNDAADKTERYAREHEWDKKAKKVTNTVTREAKHIGRSVKDVFAGK